MATESCGRDAERLYARHGLVCTFAESVRRHDLRLGTERGRRRWASTWSRSAEADPADLFTAYVSSFADRPGFVQPEPASGWPSSTSTRTGAATSRCWPCTTARPVGFINVLGRWVDQVGVVPDWRGRRMGAYLVARTLRALAVESPEPVWLCVNVNNPAGSSTGGSGSPTPAPGRATRATWSGEA